MFFGEEDSSFQNLPPEMIVEVLSLVDVEGKQSARLVCRRWTWILNHPDAGLVCFKLTNSKMTEDSVQCLLKSELYIDDLVFEDVKVTWPSMTYSRNKFPLMRKLTLGSWNSDQSLTTILQYGCAQTESLVLTNSCLIHFRLDALSRVLSGMRWNLLTELSIYVTVYETHYFEEINLLLRKSRIPNLKAVNLDVFAFGDELSTGIAKVMTNFMIFLEHHSTALRELRLGLCLWSNLEKTLVFPNICAPLFSAEEQTSVARDLKLKCLHISTTHFDALLHLVPPCVWESENLTKLTWCPMLDLSYVNGSRSSTATPRLIAPPGTVKPLQSLIQRNRNTLTQVTTTSILGDIDVDPFDLTWLESSHHLRELSITNCDKFLSVKLQFPTVRKLDIGLTDFKSIENICTWIQQTFRNLESVQFAVDFATRVQNWPFDWIQSLLLVSRVGEIRFLFTYQYVESAYDFTGPNLIQQYCSDKDRLIFRGQRQGGREDDLLRTGPCVIKLLPIRNYN